MQEQQPNPWKTMYEKQQSGAFQSWTPTRDKVIELRKHHPEMTLQAIGTELGISRERVRQILTSENIETRSLGRIPVPMPLCKNCNNPVPLRKRIYCSPECQRPNGKTTTHCHFCNKEIVLMSAQYRARSSRATHIHCSRECRGADRRGKTNLRYNK